MRRLVLLLTALAMLRAADPPATLLDSLAAAQTDAERSRILDSAGAAADADLYTAIRSRAGAARTSFAYDRALRLNLAAIALAERLRDPGKISWSLYALAQVYLDQGKAQEAQPIVLRSVEAAEAAGEKKRLAQVLQLAGMTYYSLGDYVGAVREQERGLGIARESGDLYTVALLASGCAADYVVLGRYRAAADAYEESLRDAEAVHDKGLMQNDLQGLAVMYQNQGDPEVALAYMERMRKLGPPADKHYEAYFYELLANIYFRLRRLDEGVQAASAAVRIAREIGDEMHEANARNRLGRLLKEQGKLAQAKEEYLRSAAIAERRHNLDAHTTVMVSLTWAEWEMGEHAQALETAGKAVALARELGSPYHKVLALTAAGHVYRRMGRRDDAANALREAIELGEAFRRRLAGGELDGRGFTASVLATAYEELLLVKIDQGLLEEGLQLAELAKARQLLDVFNQGDARVTAAMTEEEKNREQELARRAAKANAALAADPNPDRGKRDAFAQAARDLDAFHAQLYIDHPRLKVRRGEEDPVRLAAMRPFLPDDRTLLLEFFIADDQVGAFAIERDPAGEPVLSVARLHVDGRQLEKQIGAFQRQLATRDLAYRTAAATLYREVMAPFARQLRNKKLVGIVPDQALWNLPFPALLAPDGKHWIEHAAVFYAPSLMALRDSARHPHAAPALDHTLLAIGPAGDKAPIAAAEARELGRLYGSSARVLSGDEGTETRWRREAPDFRILHVATHGILNSNNPMFSYLELKPDSAADGMLEAREILDLDLHAELAVLSACETARGTVREGEGLVGMGWAVMMAGIPSVVVSQWKVDAESTTRLMLTFHRGIQRGIQSHPAGSAPLTGKAEALRRAALDVLATPAYQHPFYWAGFQMLGDGY